MSGNVRRDRDPCEANPSPATDTTRRKFAFVVDFKQGDGSSRRGARKKHPYRQQHRRRARKCGPGKLRGRKGGAHRSHEGGREGVGTVSNPLQRGRLWIYRHAADEGAGERGNRWRKGYAGHPGGGVGRGYPQVRAAASHGDHSRCRRCDHAPVLSARKLHNGPGTNVPMMMLHASSGKNDA